MNVQADVVVVGAGPTGLLLAGDLAAAGVRTTVLESRQQESNLTRAFALHARSLEMLDARGLADGLVEIGEPIRGLRLFDQLSVDLSGLPSRFRYVLVTPQYNIERMLEERAVAAGAQIVRGAKVTGLRQDDGVTVVAQTGEYRAKYVVGCDGVRSAVRTALGLEFPGKAIVKSLMLADVRLTDAPEGVLAVNAAGDCFAFVAPYGDGWYRIFAWDRRNPLPDSAPVDLNEVREVTRRALGTDFGMHDPRWLSRFHSDERQVVSYRVDRVFLAGDAAHVHTPAGGQGMNTGLQDAANLSWKLAAAVQGHAPDGLLDTYQSERHPVGRMVLRSSGAIIRLTMIQSRPGRLARNSIGAVALQVGAVGRKVSGMISGIGIEYPAPSGAHHLVGRRASDVLLAAEGPGPVRLYEALRAGRFVLLTPPGQQDALPAGWVDRVRAFGVAHDTDTTVLVRPDGYMAWAGDEADPAALTLALTAWCGTPSDTRDLAR
jgi:2-polyprenyl-6-methoxyphenol hydroxylase-like FAD-dependent oxidoreductase